MFQVDVSSGFVEIGKIIKPFGIKGELKVLFYIDSISDLKKVETFYIKDRKQEFGFREMKFRSLVFSDNPEHAKVFFTDITDRTMAETWRLVPLFIKEEFLISLPDGEYFIKDLMDLEAWYRDQQIGVITNVFEVAGQEIFVIKQVNTKMDLAVPFNDRYVSDILLEERKILFDHLDELL
ncbi:MAG: ribosome maturation factor RimM [Brevinema sp.]